MDGLFMETTRKSFEQQLAFGKEGEHEIAKYFIEKEYATLTLYQFNNLTEAPKIFTSQKALISPDLFVANKERCFWVEVKTKNRWIVFGEHETGCNQAHYNNYKHVRETTGIKLYLIFNHKENDPLGYYMVDIDTPPSRIWDGYNVKTGQKVSPPMALWRMMSLIKINDAPQPAKPVVKIEQGSLNFDNYYR
jgi:hypothetical protein